MEYLHWKEKETLNPCSLWRVLSFIIHLAMWPKSLFGKRLIPSHTPFLKIGHRIPLMIGQNSFPCLKHFFPPSPLGIAFSHILWFSWLGAVALITVHHQTGVGMWPEVANRILLSRICFLDGDTQRQKRLRNDLSKGRPKEAAEGVLILRLQTVIQQLELTSESSGRPVIT